MVVSRKKVRSTGAVLATVVALVLPTYHFLQDGEVTGLQLNDFFRLHIGGTCVDQQMSVQQNHPALLLVAELTRLYMAHK